MDAVAHGIQHSFEGVEVMESVVNAFERRGQLLIRLHQRVHNRLKDRKSVKKRKIAKNNNQKQQPKTIDKGDPAETRE